MNLSHQKELAKEQAYQEALADVKTQILNDEKLLAEFKLNLDSEKFIVSMENLAVGLLGGTTQMKDLDKFKEEASNCLDAMADRILEKQKSERGDI